MMAGAKMRGALTAAVFLALSILLAVPTGATAALDETITIPAPTTAAVGGYDLPANMLATVKTSETTGRLAAPMQSLAPPKGSLLMTSSAIAAEGAGRGLSSVDDVLGGLSKGRQPSVRTVGSDRELQSVYDDLARRGSPIEVAGYKGSWVERSDGVRIGLRDVSKSGGRTIDVRLPDGTIFKVHIG